MSQPKCSFSNGAPVGIRVSRGVTPRIPVGGMVINYDQDGVSGGSVRLELQLDTCIHWLEIAMENLAKAKLAHEKSAAGEFENDSELDLLIDQEFKASVQASVAAATFFESLYAATLERMPIKPAAHTPNTRKKQARFAKVAEQLRVSFGLKRQGIANLRSVLGELYRFRDEAVHPSSKFGDPVLHPILQVGVERRYVMFSYPNARQLVRAALAYSKMLPLRDLTKKPKAIQDFAAYLRTVTEPLYPSWEQMHGPLFDV
ncbi:hypothetical protein [Dechloromonas denitrificans]|uniref:hypothetical protein n=1 Tax=Dechloromonas denitrificans TaxID=281362 RepID=UPI001CF8656D|nr:hypothetical protein [Dechloromonas denitrificans]UCV01731.1 hypothetical protein KI611_11415 [Dechloromonas denitrificans]